MPRWNVGELPDAPRFTWKNWASMLGPGLLAGGAAIGGGEWLMGPVVTARFGGSLLWLATLSIVGQVIYNIEISRYTLYTGEPIFTGKFRTLPGPQFWVIVYLILDFGSVFPYLAANAATPLAAVLLGEMPNAESGHVTLHIAGLTAAFTHKQLIRWLSYVIFLGALIPLIFGGKIYNALKAVMSFKIITVMGFLIALAIFQSHWQTWVEIGSGFFKFGSVPSQSAPIDSTDDANRAGTLNPANDKSDGIPAGSEVENAFVSLWQHGRLPHVDWAMIAFLSALVAISGNGGLSNTPISNYTRDQGWGMGSHVGAIPSVFGGQNIQLSHVGTVFLVSESVLPRWKRWYRHVVRDQAAVWMPACFFGLALPSMLSVEFLKRGQTISSGWTAAGFTAGAVRDRVAASMGSPAWGSLVWYMTLFCGFLVLAPTMAASADGVVRRWVDVFWTASKTLRAMDPGQIRYVYFGTLIVLSAFGLVMLSMNEPTRLLLLAGMIYNFALAFSCFHTVFVNTVLLPKELRPAWFVRTLLVGFGLFFFIVGTLATLHDVGVI
jgi:Mn2+/Fe2+ NRAMP family transporter